MPSPVRPDSGITSVNWCSRPYHSMRGRSLDLSLKLSILLSTRKARLPMPLTRSRANLSPAPGRSAASTTRSTRSSVARASTVIAIIRRFISYPGLWIPGVSTKAIWPSGRDRTPVIRFLVVCGLSETIAIFWPTSLLSSVDLPAFGLPASVTNPHLPVREDSSTDIDGSSIAVLAGLRQSLVLRLVRGLYGPQADTIYAAAVSLGDFEFEALVFKLLTYVRDVAEFGD